MLVSNKSTFLKRLFLKLKMSFNAGRTLEEDRKKAFALGFYFLSSIIKISVIVYVLSAKLTVCSYLFAFSSADFQAVLEAIFEKDTVLIHIVAILYCFCIIFLNYYYWHVCSKRNLKNYLKKYLKNGIIFSVIFLIGIVILSITRAFSVAAYILVILYIAQKIISYILFRKAAECEEINGENDFTVSHVKAFSASQAEENETANCRRVNNTEDSNKLSDAEPEFLPKDTEKEYVVKTAEKCMSKIFFAIFLEIAVIIFLFSAIIIARHRVEFLIENSYIYNLNSDAIGDLTKNMSDLDNILVYTAIFSFIVLAINIPTYITNTRTSLCLTNKRVIGNTGKLFGNSILNLPLSQISECRARTTWIKSGVVMIKAFDGKVYSFFIKSPYIFEYALNEEIKKQ